MSRATTATSFYTKKFYRIDTYVQKTKLAPKMAPCYVSYLFVIEKIPYQTPNCFVPEQQDR